MHILIVSDSHGRQENLYHTILMVQPDLLIHLGDAQGMEHEIQAEANCPMWYVRGNCDFATDADICLIKTIGKHKAFITHGDRFGVKYSDADLITTAEKYGCDVAMYGHTHWPELVTADHMSVLNPGSISYPRQPGRKPSYIVCDLDNDGELHFSLNYLE